MEKKAERKERKTARKKQQEEEAKKCQAHLRSGVAAGCAVDTRARTRGESGRRAGCAREARISGNVDGLARADATVCVRAKG